ncbi:MAG: potassium-transporting ATPase subunit KdpA [Clostridium sp.]
MVQIIITLLIFLILVVPVGRYLCNVGTGEKSFVDPLFDKIDNLIYKICRIEKKDMGWKQYAIALVVTNVVMCVVAFIVLKIQGIGLLNPNGIEGMSTDLSFNTVISFMTNTNLQHYSGESGLSYLSQMLVIIFMMFTSAATGYSACMAFIRGITQKGTSIGNYYRDMVRTITRVLLPISFVISLLLVTQGVPQNLSQNLTVQTIEGKSQDIAMGPVAALESIKHLGTNGGGFFGANSSTPFENPTVISNMIEMISMMLLPGGFVVAFGLMVYRNRRKRAIENKEKVDVKRLSGEGRAIFVAMSIIFVIGLVGVYFAEHAGNPALESIGLSQSMGNMEGKEVRFGIDQSALFTNVTTAFTTGTVNNMHDTLTPLGGAVPLLNMMLNVVFGGKGVGLMNMIIYVILTVFICGLMIGRTPEYLNRKIEGKEMKLAAISIIIHPLLILGFSALAVITSGGLDGITNPGSHGLTQVLYEFASSAANNGSGFEGLADNTMFWNITTGIVMFIGRYVPLMIQLAIAGSLLKKRYVNESIGTLKTNTLTFSIALVMIVLLIGALTFLPSLILGPITEHLTLWN